MPSTEFSSVPGLRVLETDGGLPSPVFESKTVDGGTAPVTADENAPVATDGNDPVTAEETCVAPLSSEKAGNAPVLAPDVRIAPQAVQRSSEAGTSRPQSGQFMEGQAIMGLFEREG